MNHNIPEIGAFRRRTDKNSCLAMELELISVERADTLMQQLAELRQADLVPDMALILAHPATLAVGARKLQPQDLLRPLEFFQSRGIGLIQSIRGGGLTYHWPGQIVCYPVMKLAPQEQNIAMYVYRLEEVGLRTLREFGIEASRKREKAAQIGLWLGNRKIASMGIHVSRWVTSYGFALNVSGNAEAADFIRPCGLDGVKLITMSEVLGYDPGRRAVTTSLLRQFEQVFDRKIHAMTMRNLTWLNQENADHDISFRNANLSSSFSESLD
ncbi:MAG: lipoyl(octanoyl) transferase LipB [Candidatus Zhuqueibacterota bacterium]